VISIRKTYLLIFLSFLEGFFPSFCNGTPHNTTNPPIKAKDAHLMIVDNWTVESATQQKVIKGVLPSENGKLTLIEIKNPCIAKTDKENFIPKDTSQIIVVDVTKQILWQTPEDMDCFSPQWSPNGKDVSFISFNEKEELYTLWASPAEIYAPKKITSQKREISGYLWSPDGKHMALLTSIWSAISNEFCYDFGTVRTYTDLIIIPLDTSLQTNFEAPIKSLLPRDYYFPKHFHDPRKVMAWSPDSQDIVFVTQATDSRKGGLYSVNIHSKKVSILHDGNHPFYPMYSLDGNHLAFVADSEKGESLKETFPIKKRNLFLKNLKSGKDRTLPDTFGNDPILVGWSHDNQYLLIQEGYKTLNKLYKIFVEDNKTELLNSDNQFLSSVSINRSGTSIGFVAETPNTLPRAFVSSLNEFSPHLVFEEPSLTLPLKAELIQWTAFDGEEIEGILIYPFSYEKGHSYPLVVGVHDGPYGAWTQRFMGNYYENLPFAPAVLAAEGYAVLLPNIRGSSNYGLYFSHANQEDLGGKDFEDIMAGVDLVIRKGVANPEKLAIWGWGYGGYLAAWATTQTNRFKAAIVGEGIIDFIAFAENSTLSNLLASYLGGNFWENKERWISRSPIMHISKSNTPTFIQYSNGEREAYPPDQGMELKYALKSRNIPVSYLQFDLEGHTFDKLSLSRKIGMESTIRWLKIFLDPQSSKGMHQSATEIYKLTQKEKRRS
jgi:dipeptidyl aminopeptidase/acylaminoacyl peptidase